MSLTSTVTMLEHNRLVKLTMDRSISKLLPLLAENCFTSRRLSVTHTLPNSALIYASEPLMRESVMVRVSPYNVQAALASYRVAWSSSTDAASILGPPRKPRSGSV